MYLLKLTFYDRWLTYIWPPMSTGNNNSWQEK